VNQVMASKKSKVYAAVLISVVAIPGSSVAVAVEPSPVPVFSPDIHLGHSNVVVADEDSAYTTGVSLGRIDLGLLPESADVDAVHALASGEILFSLETSIVLGDTLYRPSDVIRFNGSTWSMEFDGRTAGIPDGVNVDAIAMSDETLLLSLNVDALLGSTAYSDADVIAFDGVNFSIFLDASSVGIPTSSDVDALHVDDQGRVLVSLDDAGVLGGIHYRDEDLLAWATPDWSLEFDGSADDAAWVPVDMDAWSIVFLDDNIFESGFE